MTKTNVQPIPSNSQHHDTPNNKTHVIKFRVTAEEKTSLELTCKLLNLSLSTFIRRAIHNVKIEKTVIVAGGGEETLTAVSTLLAQCSKVGGNLNQLARHLNSGGADTEQIRAKLLDELADLLHFGYTPRKFWVNCMATLKHISSKNSATLHVNRTAAVSVLLSRALQADKLAADLSDLMDAYRVQSGKIPVSIDEVGAAVDR